MLYEDLEFRDEVNIRVVQKGNVEAVILSVQKLRYQEGGSSDISSDNAASLGARLEPVQRICWWLHRLECSLSDAICSAKRRTWANTANAA